MPLAEIVSSYFPGLKHKLRLADMNDNPIEFLEKTLTSTIYVSLALVVVDLSVPARRRCRPLTFRRCSSCS